MKADPVTVRHLLENRQRFCVPIYQRHYVWKREEHWDPFWNDVRTEAIKRLTRNDRRFSHYMGGIVLETRGDVSSRKVMAYQVVDGQQRLTTFQLFLSAVHDYASVSGFEKTADHVERFLFNDRPHLMENEDIEKFKVWPTEFDRKLFQDILQCTRKELRQKYHQYFYRYRDKIYTYSTVPNLLGAYGFFYECIRQAVETDELDDGLYEIVDDMSKESPDSLLPSDQERMENRLDAIWEALIEEFKVVEIILEDGDDAQVIFETMNDRGEPLLAADLMRNNIFHRADSQGEDPEKLFSEHWTPLEDPFWSQMEKQGRYRKPRIEFFIANFISGQIANEVTMSKLFSEYKAFLKHINKTRDGGYSSVEDEIKDLVRYSIIYQTLVTRSKENALGNFGRLLYVWDVTTVFPLLLRLWAHNGLGDAEKKNFLPILLSFIVRRAVCGLTTKNYNKLFLSLVRHLDEVGWSHGQLTKYLTTQKSDVARFPNDEEFHRAWMSIPAYNNLPTTRVRFILEHLELAKRKKYQETDDLSSQLSIEHILPTEWREHWPFGGDVEFTNSDFYQALYAPEDEDTVIGRIARRMRLKDTFGNLTLLTQPLNSKVSNGPFIAKRAALNEHSLLVLNREITKEEEWGEEQIETRGVNLFSLARELWRYPDSPTSDV